MLWRQINDDQTREDATNKQISDLQTTQVLGRSVRAGTLTAVLRRFN